MKTTTKKTTSKTASAVSSAKNMQDSEFHKFFVDELKDVYWAEKALSKALPKMERAATSAKLKEAFKKHTGETKNHISILEKVFELAGSKAAAKKCDAMAGILEEGKSIIEDTKKSTMTRDAGLILGAQKAEHYEIATYGTLRVFANHMGHTDIAVLIQEILDSEKACDATLTSIAEDFVNVKAAGE